MKPCIVAPIGDPAGVGPEILVKAFADAQTQKYANCVAIGDKQIVEDAIKITGVPLKLKVIAEPAEGNYDANTLNLININNIDMAKFTRGKVAGMCGRAAYQYIEKSIELTMAHKADAVATTPINK